MAATWFPNLKGLAVGVVACGASIGGVIYPVILRECLEKYDFRIACIVVGGFSLGTMIFALVFATPNPDHPKSKSSNWGSMSTWIDVEAFGNPAWVWFTLAVAFMFFGFYPVFFNIEEVSVKRFTLPYAYLTSASGLPYMATEHATAPGL